MTKPKENWVKERNIYFGQNQPKHPYSKTRQSDYEAGASAKHRVVIEYLKERTYGFDDGNGKMVYKTVYEEGEWEEFIGELIGD